MEKHQACKLNATKIAVVVEKKFCKYVENSKKKANMTEMWHNSQNCCVRMIVLLKNRQRFGIAKSNKFVLRFTHLALSLQLIKQQPDETKFFEGAS